MDSAGGLTFENWLSIAYNVTQLIVFFAGGAWFLVRLDFRIRELITDRKADTEANRLRFDKIEEELQKLVAAMVQLARQEERLNALDARVSDLSKRVENNRRDKLPKKSKAA